MRTDVVPPGSRCEIDAALASDLFPSLWAMITSLPLEARRDASALDEKEMARGVTATLEIAGAWNGSVVVWCAAAAAAQAAAAVLQQDSAPTPEEVADVAGEVANVLAGKLKTTLPGPSRLSLPAVTTGTPPPSVPGVLVARAWFVCGDEPICVAVWSTGQPEKE